MQHRSSETILDLTPPQPPLRIAYGGEPEQFGDLWLPDCGKPPPGGVYSRRIPARPPRSCPREFRARRWLNREWLCGTSNTGGWGTAAAAGRARLTTCCQRSTARRGWHMRLHLTRCGSFCIGHRPAGIWRCGQLLVELRAGVLPGLRGVVALAPASDFASGLGVASQPGCGGRPVGEARPTR